MVDLAHLRHFLEVLEQKSISQAAVLLRIAQPALSRQLQALERAYGTPLLVRNRRGISATPAGDVLADHARRILAAMQAAEDAVSLVAQRPAGRLTVGVTASVARLILPPLAIAARAELPDVQLKLLEDHSDVLHQRLRAGTIDIAILHERRRLPGIASRPLFSEAVVAVGASGLFSPDSPVAMKDILRFDSLVTAPSGRLRLLYEEAMARAGAPEARMSEIDSFPALIELIAAGAGVSLLPLSLVLGDGATARLSWAPLRPLPLVRHLVLARPEDRLRTPALAGIERLIGRIVVERAARYQWHVARALAGLASPAPDVEAERIY